MEFHTLDAIPDGARACIDEIVDCEAAHLLTGLGLLPGTIVSRVGQAPLGGPLVFVARGARLAIRKSHARCVRVRRIES